jgi:UDP-glucose:tetrahydrobiopterin glucosyltransferase
LDEVDSIIEKRWREGGLKLAMYTDAQVRTYPFLESERVPLLYGGVDTAVFQYNSQPRDRLCWAGRISPEKGLEDAIAVARALDMPLDVCGKMQDEAYWHAVMRDAGAQVVGSGSVCLWGSQSWPQPPFRRPEPAERLRAELPAPQNPKLTHYQVVCHGFLGPIELQRRYANARATLVTPRWIEAFGNTVIESMACGTPVVTYDRGGPAEIVEHGRSGVLSPREAGVEGLVKAVREAVGLDRRLVRARAEEFSFVRMADRFEAWIEPVADGLG